MSAQNKLCLALDVDTFEDAKALIDSLQSSVGMFKVGKQLFTRVGPKIVDYIQSKGSEVFLDLKFHDIPSTVRKAAYAVSDMGVALFNVHAMGGKDMMEGAAQGIQDAESSKSKVLGVTVLTSMDQETLSKDLKVNDSVEKYVIHLAKLAKSSGLNGVVASPHEIKLIREHCGKDFLIVTPGIRPEWANKGDQKRIMTPRQAIEAGADYIVVGRPITKADDPVIAAEKILQEMA